MKPVSSVDLSLQVAWMAPVGPHVSVNCVGFAGAVACAEKGTASRQKTAERKPTRREERETTAKMDGWMDNRRGE